MLKLVFLFLSILIVEKAFAITPMQAQIEGAFNEENWAAVVRGGFVFKEEQEFLSFLPTFYGLYRINEQWNVRAGRFLPGVPEGVSLKRSTPIDYHFVRYYSLAACTRCHYEGTGPNLSAYEGVVEHIEEVMETIRDGEMPPTEHAGYSKLTACQIEVLDQWIHDGMPETDGKPIVGLSACF